MNPGQSEKETMHRKKPSWLRRLQSLSGLACSSAGTCSPSWGTPFNASLYFAAFATEAICLALVSGVAILRPLFPANVQFLNEKAFLCQLQSRLRGKRSIVSPAVGDDLPVTRQNAGNLVQFIRRSTQRSGNISAGGWLCATRIERNEIEIFILDSRQYRSTGS